jgi:TrmH family RNA methyltransferase
MKFEDIRRLHQRKYREALGAFVVEGEHLVLELQKAAVRDSRLRTSEVYVTADHAPWKSQLATQVISAKQMAQISETRSPQGIAAVVPLLSSRAAREGQRAIYLHEVQDPGNLGTILRTLGWFGDFRCLLGPGCVDVHNGKVVRASMGAIFHVPVEVDVALATLPQRYERIATLDLAGESVMSAAFRGFDCYVFGGEARGVPHAALAALNSPAFTIPGAAAIESLNVAATVAICQYELHRD